MHGVPTTAPFHALILENDAFKAGDVDTGFILKHQETLTVRTQLLCDIGAPSSFPFSGMERWSICASAMGRAYVAN